MREVKEEEEEEEEEGTGEIVFAAAAAVAAVAAVVPVFIQGWLMISSIVGLSWGLNESIQRIKFSASAMGKRTL